MVFYFVQRGETLYGIAKRYQTTVHAIVVANRLEDPNAICPGQALIIPSPGEVPSPPPGGIVHLIRPGETVFHLATKFGTTPHEIMRANQIAHPEFILPGQQVVVPERMEPGEDWPMLGRTPGRASASPVVIKGIPTESWTYSPRKHGTIAPSAPVIRYDRVFVGLGDGQFYALDRKAGRIKWRVSAGEPESLARLGKYPLATPAVYDGLVYLCGPDGNVTAVDAATGRQIWQVPLGAVITSSPAAFDGVVYLGTWDAHVYALEAKTGALAWKRKVGGPVYHPVAVGEEHVYAAPDDGNLLALDAETGEIRWLVAGAGTQPPIFAEVVVLAGDQALDPKNGQLVWRVEAGGAVPVARQDQVVYPGGAVDLFAGTLKPQGKDEATPGPEEVIARLVATGSELPGGAPIIVPTPSIPIRHHVASSGYMLGTGFDQRLHAWEAASTQIAWTLELPQACDQPPAIAAGQIILALIDGSVVSYKFTHD
jgi:outer membrane protein assembly factor BamB